MAANESLILRTEIGRKLTIFEMDGNFQYLENLALGITGPGLTALSGPQGDVGPQGATGSQGQNGTQGATGPQGQNGTQGATGPGGNSEIIEVTYSELYDSILSQSLLPGSTYRLTDYQSYNYVHGYDKAFNNSASQSVSPGRLFREFTDTLNNNGVEFNNNIYAVAQYDGDMFIGGGFTELNGVERKYFIKLNGGGTESSSFYSNLGTSFNSDVTAIAVQPDGKILIGGNFDEFNGNLKKYLVRLNANGTEDTTFYTNLTSTGDNTGLDNAVRDIQIQDDGKILIGGYFSFLNGTQRYSLIRLNSNGTEDTTFYTNLTSTGDGTGLLGFVSTIDIDGDNNIYLGGNFTSYNGTSLNRILKLDSTGLRDETFMIEIGTGFSGDVSKIDIQSDGKILVAGNYTNFNGVVRNRLVRLLSDGTEDNTFYTNLTSLGLTSSGFSGAVFTVKEIIDGSIAVGGQFTQLNGENTYYFVKLNSDGTRDYNFKSEGLFHQLYYVDQYGTSDYLILAGEPLSYQDVELSKILMLWNVESPSGYDAREIHTGDTEVLLLRAITSYEFDKVVLSETYPSDELEYLPYCNNLGFNLEITNNNTLPDETEVSGFDLQWDAGGSMSFFEMPSTYKIEYGHYLYIYANFPGIGQIDVEFEPVTPLRAVPYWNGYNTIKINEIEIQLDGTRVYLPDLTYEQFLEYSPDSLLIRTINPDQTIKGWVTRRTDKSRNVSIPFDYKNFKFRRWQMKLPYDNMFPNLKYYGITDNDWGIDSGVVTTGNYKDYYAIQWWELNTNLTIEGVGGPDGGYFKNGRTDNIIFMGSANDSTIGNDFRYNTFFSDFDNNIIESDFGYNILDNDFTNNKISTSFNHNVVSSFNYNTVRNGFEFNTISSAFYGNKVGRDFNNNEIRDYFEVNTIGDWFNSNEIWNTFSYNTVDHEFNNNVIYNNSNNNIIGFGFYNNTIGVLNEGFDFNANIIGNDMKGNLILGEFIVNTIEGDFYSNEIGDSFNRNKIGQFFQNNTLGTNFIDNQIGNYFQYNDPIGNDFENNIIGNYFNNNNSIGYNFAYNVIGHVFQGNTIGNDFGFGGGQSRGNRIGNYFTNNTIGEYFYDNVVADIFDNNTIGGYFQQNQIPRNVYNTDFIQYYQNIISFTDNTGASSSIPGTDGYYSTVTASGGNGYDALFDVTVSGDIVTLVTLAESGYQYQVGDILTISYTSFLGVTGSNIEITVGSVSSTPAVYGNYTKTIFRNSNNNLKLSYYDENDVLTIQNITN